MTRRGSGVGIAIYAIALAGALNGATRMLARQDQPIGETGSS